MSVTQSSSRARRAVRTHALVLVPVLLACLGVSARASTVLSFVPSTVEVNCLQFVDVDLAIDAGAADLRGYSLVVDFDAALLPLVDVVPGALLDAAPCDPFLHWFVLAPGQIQIDAAGLGCSVAGPGAIARLRFQGLADGVSPLVASEALLRNSANLPIAWTTDDGEVWVNCPVSNDVHSWSTVKSTYR